MKRNDLGRMRLGWEATVAAEGLAYGRTTTPDGTEVSYWRERQHYVLTKSEMDLLTQVGKTLFRMFVEAGQYVIDNNLFYKLGIPDFAVEAIKLLWKDPEDLGARVGWYTPMLYGRFDLCPVLDGGGNITNFKLYEYNADTPTGMVEASVSQWNWFVGNGYMETTTGQFNELFEDLVAAWKHEIRRFRRTTNRKVKLVHFAYSGAEMSGEDKLNTEFMMSAARKASDELMEEGERGFKVRLVTFEEIWANIGANDAEEIVGLPTFRDDEGTPIEFIFKLFPWEWLLDSDYGRAACVNMMHRDGVVWVEPIWKMLWSNKGILAILWTIFKDRPEAQYLIPAYFRGEEAAGFSANSIFKPLHGREGAGTILTVDGQVAETGPEGYNADNIDNGAGVLQQYHPLPGFHSEFDGIEYHPVLGLFTVQDGMSTLLIRESPNKVTNNLSFAVPHYIVGLTYSDFE